jgi:hypothetical protein
VPWRSLPPELGLDPDGSISDVTADIGLRITLREPIGLHDPLQRVRQPFPRWHIGHEPYRLRNWRGQTERRWLRPPLMVGRARHRATGQLP